MEKIRFYFNEEYKEFTLHESLKLRYAITSFGRIISFKNDVFDGRFLKGSLADGYKIIHYKIRIDDKLKNKYVFVYKLVAENFVEKSSENQTYVLHLDYVRDNDKVKNLKWATREEMIQHSNKSPHVLAARQRLIEHNKKADGAKLTSTSVMRIKKMLQDSNRKTRIKMIAKQFGVSEMQIFRIQSGENWSHIKV